MNSLRTSLSPCGSRQTSGFSLIECLVYMAVFTVVVALAVSVYDRTITSSRAFTRTADQIGAAMRAGERWRGDIRSTSGPITATVQGTNETLVIPQRSGAVRYRFEDGGVSRQTGDETNWVLVLSTVKSSRMEADARQKVTAWRWELELNTREKSPRVRPLFTFEAVPASPAFP